MAFDMPLDDGDLDPHGECRHEIRRLTELNNLILSGLRWTGDGYEWTGAEYDYRLKPDEAVQLMQQDRERMRSILRDLAEFDRKYPRGGFTPRRRWGRSGHWMRSSTERSR